MGMTRQTAAAVAACLMVELEADREDEGENELNEGFAIADQLKISGLILEINGDGAVFLYCFGGVTQCHPYLIRPRKRMRYDAGNALKDQDNWGGLTALPQNSMECETCNRFIKKNSQSLAGDTLILSVL